MQTSVTLCLHPKLSLPEAAFSEFSWDKELTELVQIVLCSNGYTSSNKKRSYNFDTSELMVTIISCLLYVYSYLLTLTA